MIIMYALLLLFALACLTFVIVKAIVFVLRKIHYVTDLMEIQNELLYEQNELMEELFELFGDSSADINAVRRRRTISDADKKIVEQLKKEIKGDELILKIRYNGRIEKWKKADWAMIVRMGHRGRFDLLFMN